MGNKLVLRSEGVKAMLNASLNAQKEFLTPDMNTNIALRQAAFNVESKLTGNQKHFVAWWKC